MTKLRLGRINSLNCLPVYYALEEGLLPLDGELVKGTPTFLNRLFWEGGLHCTPLSSIEYARHPGECLILPHLSIAADGRVASVLLFSRLPVTELENRTVCVTTASATSVALLRVLFEHYYHVEAEFRPASGGLAEMLKEGDAALLIGDEAMIAHHRVAREGIPLVVTDLGQAWKDFTGEKMVFAVWAVRREFAEAFPQETALLARTLLNSWQAGMESLPAVVNKAHRQTGLPPAMLNDYFRVIHYRFDESYRRGLLLYYDYAYKSGLIEERVKLNIWGE
ncbi:menaquinone biosynthetic enzyme MqnA/MqnD family protein [Desulfovirgula thermocuniculi]|uniref:menaquinone biosynthetic enzyme MqnA/MqnD family protein n=1 Tax=Desulfovirgula thermocuniculi TaxID=348842 RepID=UPI00042646FA|nr:menaquinone biosynthesis protein [Desulfovirgula thermocuniculi]